MPRKSTVQFTVTIPLVFTLHDGVGYKDAMQVIDDVRVLVEQGQFMNETIKEITMDKPIVQKKVVY